MFKRILSTLLILGFTLLVSPTQAEVLQSPKRMSDLAERDATMAIATGDYKGAIAHIHTVFKYIATIDNPEILEQLKPKVEQLSFTLAFCHVASGDFAAGITKLNDFLKKYPNTRRRLQVLKLRAFCEYTTNKWEALVGTLKRVLTAKSLPSSERMELIMLLGEAHRSLDQHEEALKAFGMVMSNADDPSLRMSSISYLLEAILKLEKADLLYKLVPRLQGGVSPAKYSLAFNFKAIEAADKLAAAGNTSPALVLLKLCQPLDEIKAGLSAVKQSLEYRKASLSRRPDAVRNSLHQILAVERRLEKVNAEIAAAEVTVDYDEGLRFRVAQLLFEMELYYESYWNFVVLLETFPDSKNIPHALYAASILASEVGLTDRALEHAETLITQYPESDRAAEAALSMAYIFQQGQQFDRMHKHLKEAHARGNFRGNVQDQNHAWYLVGYSRLYKDQFEEALENFDHITGPSGSSRFHRDSDYWRAYIEMFTDNYPEAVKKFEAFLKQYPQGAYVEDAHFRLALARFGMGDMEGTRAVVENFMEQFPNSTLRGEAYNLMGDVYGSLGLLDEAIAAYELVDVFTDDPNQVHTATFNAARVMAADARWEQVVKHFKRYLNRYGKNGRFTMAIYKIGEALVSLGRVDEALENYWKTILQFANDPQALGIDLMLRDYVADYQRVYIEKVTSKQAAIRKGRRNLAALARETDKALSDEQREAALKAEMEKEVLEAAQVFEQALSDAKNLIIEQLKDELEDTPNDTTQETKRLRLNYGLNFAKATRGVSTYFSERQVAAGTPLTLDWMARILRKKGKHDLAAVSYQRVISDFPETEVSANAYMGLGELERARGNNDKALEYFSTVYELYPTSENTGTAVMHIADILFDKEQYGKAAAQYEEIILVREWRGPLWPEALYKVGLCKLKQGAAENAFAYFQRVYVLYGGYTEWAARAYLESGKSLEELGRNVEAARTYREMLEVDALAKTAEGREALNRMDKLPPPPPEVVEESSAS